MTVSFDCIASIKMPGYAHFIPTIVGTLLEDIHCSIVR